jgi:uncharacterized membrane protein YdjX (TVP38/TMEM64 family)
VKRLKTIFKKLLSPTKFIVGIIICVLLLQLLIKYFSYFNDFFSNAQAFNQILKSNGKFYGPLILIALQTLQIILAPIPGHLIGFISGLLFGVIKGTLYSMIGIILGSTIDFWLARILGRRFLKKFVPAEKMRTFDIYLLKYGSIVILILLLLPFSPLGDVIYYLSGLTPIPYIVFILMVIIARFPNSLFFNLLGANVLRVNLISGLIFLGILLVIGILFYWGIKKHLPRILSVKSD